MPQSDVFCFASQRNEAIKLNFAEHIKQFLLTVSYISLLKPLTADTHVGGLYTFTDETIA